MSEETAVIFAEVLHKPAFAPVMTFTFRLCLMFVLFTLWKLTTAVVLGYTLGNDGGGKV